MEDGAGGGETRGRVQLRMVKAEGPTELRTMGVGWPRESAELVSEGTESGVGGFQPPKAS